jgi:hypothetical protein
MLGVEALKKTDETPSVRFFLPISLLDRIHVAAACKSFLWNNEPRFHDLVPITDHTHKVVLVEFSSFS